jgi:hypothetical protein
MDEVKLLRERPLLFNIANFKPHIGQDTLKSVIVSSLLDPMLTMMAVLHRDQRQEPNNISVWTM